MQGSKQRRRWFLVGFLALVILGGVAAPTAIAAVTGAPSIEAAAAAAVNRDTIVQIADDQIGASEANERCTKYGPCLQHDWCAMFVEWVWDRAGVDPVPDTWIARGVGQWGEEGGLFKPRPAGSRGNPEPGDIVVYGAPGMVVGGHVSLVASVNSNGTITTIDGNYDDAVVRRTINPVTQTAGSGDHHISGYVSPPNVSLPPAAPVYRVGRAAVEFREQVHVFARGPGDEVRQHYWVPNAGWTYYRNLGGAVTSQPVAVEHLGGMHVFARGADGDLQHRVHNGSAWETWRTVPGGFSSEPAVVEMDGTLHVFVRTGDGTVRHRFHSTSGWNDGGWRDLGGAITGDPTAVIFKNQMFVFGRGTDGQVRFRYWRADAGWSGWGVLNGQVVGRLATATQNNVLSVFARDPNNQLRQHVYVAGTDGGWQPYKALAGAMRGDPDAVGLNNQMHVFIRAADNTIKYRFHDGGAWTDWRDLGGTMNSSPFIGTRGGNRFVYATGTDNQLRTRFWAPTTGWSPWETLPGPIHPLP